MPKSAPINPDLIRAVFDYDPATGKLTPKPTTANAARRISSAQWEIGHHRYSLNRLVWAWHNPQDPNPYAVQFHDGNRANTCIENLYSVATHPRWVNHIKQVPAKMDKRTGKITYAPGTAEWLEARRAEHATTHARTPKTPSKLPPIDTSVFEEFDQD